MDQVVKRVAVAVRHLRESRGVSLSELARAAGISKGTLSQLEAGRVNPTVETLWALAQALGVPFGDLVADPARPAVQVSRASEGGRIEGDVMIARLLQRLRLQGLLEVYELTVRAGKPRESGPHAAGVVEHLYVARGRLRVGPLDGAVELEAGDWGTFRADVPHVYEAIGTDVDGMIAMAYPNALPPPVQPDRSNGLTS